jgi:phage tail sheath protein FI
MATKVYATPGVYIQEKDAFPSSVVAVPTAVPAFIGYTEKAMRGTKSLTNVPTRITSMAEYLELFGGAPETKFELSDPAAAAAAVKKIADQAKKDADKAEKEATTKKTAADTAEKEAKTKRTDADAARKKADNTPDTPAADKKKAEDAAVKAEKEADTAEADFEKAKADYDTAKAASDDAKQKHIAAQVAHDKAKEASDAGAKYVLEVDPKTRFNMFQAMRLFYSNGGGPCYIVSVGGYDYTKGVEAKALNDEGTLSGLPTLLKEHEPTLVVIPDAVLLKATACYSLQKQMIAHCQKMMNRFAILDVYQGDLPPGGNAKVISAFREGVNLGGKSMQWAAAYYPWLETTTIQDSEIDFTAISNLPELVTRLKEENAALLPSPTQKGVADDNKERREAIDAEIDKLPNTTDSEGISVLSNTLLAVSPMFKDILKDISKAMNLMAPSAGIAGVYSKVDNDYGVQKAPANVGMMNVVKPAVNLTNVQQEDLNLPLNGLAVNAIRSFVGKGLLVWGARTLDGNSQDWRYINVRRAMIFLEQSIKNAAEAYVFEPNDANTWASIKSMIINFLTVQWRAGLLVGATQDDAFRVDVGLGVTMTPTDILDGVMNITVKVAISRPAEFIVITFQQQMQKS